MANTCGYLNSYKNSIIRWCDFGGVSMGDYSKALNCELVHHGATGGNASQAEAFVLSDCRIAYNNYRKFKSQWHAGGVQIS